MQTHAGCSASNRDRERLGAAPFRLDSAASCRDDRRVIAAQAPIRQIGATERDRGVRRADPRAIAGQRDFFRIAADAHAHAVADKCAREPRARARCRAARARRRSGAALRRVSRARRARSRRCCSTRTTRSRRRRRRRGAPRASSAASAASASCLSIGMEAASAGSSSRRTTSDAFKFRSSRKSVPSASIDFACTGSASRAFDAGRPQLGDDATVLGAPAVARIVVRAALQLDARRARRGSPPPRARRDRPAKRIGRARR